MYIGPLACVVVVRDYCSFRRSPARGEAYTLFVCGKYPAIVFGKLANLD